MPFRKTFEYIYSRGNNTKASVLIANYNNEKYIEECLNSILNQTYKNIEIIVIDDDSSDNSSKIINKFKDKIIIANKKDKKTKIGSMIRC